MEKSPKNNEQADTQTLDETVFEKKYNVLLHNDDYTTMDFVIDVIQRVFHKPADIAENLTMKIHFEGSAVCGAYCYEIAETKVNLVHSLAAKQNFPLKASMEPI